MDKKNNTTVMQNYGEFIFIHSKDLTPRQTFGSGGFVSSSTAGRLIKFFVIFFLLVIIVLCAALFRFDLLQTINNQNKEPIGSIIEKRNELLSLQIPPEIINNLPELPSTQTPPEIINNLHELVSSQIPPEVIKSPPELHLVSPSSGARIQGLTALRQPTVFRWECDAQLTVSKFVLSKNKNPFLGKPEIVIQNPSRTVSVNKLGEGTWYWNIEAKTPDGGIITSSETGSFYIQAIPLLPASQTKQPAKGHRFEFDELKSLTKINFSWSSVQGANAYIFTLYQQAGGKKQQIIRTKPENKASYTLENLRLLDRGNFIWQVEAVNVNRNNAVEQHGRLTESSFVIDYPSLSPVEIKDFGVYYGN